MNSYFFKGILVCVFSFMAVYAMAQARDSLKTVSVGFTPQHLIQSAMRIDLEKEIGKKRHRLLLSPYFYTGYTYFYEGTRTGNRVNTTNNRRDEIGGVGGEFQFKYRITRRERYGFPFFSAGLGVHRIRLSYDDVAWQTFQEIKGEVLRLMPATLKERITRLDAIFTVGYRAFMGQHFACDVYGGVVARTAWIDVTPDAPPRDHQEIFFLHGFEGAILRVGLTFSVML